jgi:hypothetical protein
MPLDNLSPFPEYDAWGLRMPISGQRRGLSVDMNNNCLSRVFIIIQERSLGFLIAI